MKKSVGTSVMLFIVLAFSTIRAFALDTNLIVGRNTDAVGIVSISKTGDYLEIKYAITDPNWCLTKTHMHVAPSPVNIPQTKNGNPIPGRFDYRGTFDYDPTNNMCGVEYTYMYQLFGATGTFYIAAHADVKNQMNQKEEGAWADGSEFPGGNWATYLTYTVPASPPAPIPR